MKTSVTKNSILNTVILTLMASFIYLVNSGIRNNFGIMLSAISQHAGLTFASVSFVLAVGQFSFGITQPFSGFIADRLGNRFSLLTGIICSFFSILILPFCRNQWSLMLILGILLPGALGMISYGILVSTISPHLPKSSLSFTSGVVNASSGIGNTLLTPIISTTIIAGGLVYGASVLAVFTAVTFPCALIICSGYDKRSKIKSETAKADVPSVSQLIKLGISSKDYIFIVLGFFTCGFHMALITNHLATQIMSYGFTYESTSKAFSIYGIATIVGALLSGAICSRLRMKNVLGSLYFSRTIWTILFLILPKTFLSICIYIILLGLTGAATVAPVTGICRKLFGERGVSIFFGIAFVAHQIGGFLSSWIGGVLFQSSGINGYTLIWIADCVLCVFAAIVSYMIKTDKSSII